VWQFIGKIRQSTAEIARASVMLLVLRPAADWLPLELARCFAQCIGFFIAVSPTRGRLTYSAMRTAFGFPKMQAFVAAQQWLSRPFLDFVFLRQVVRGRRNCTQWNVKEVSSDAVRRIKESGQPFIVATGHFARESFLGLLLPNILPHRIGIVAAPRPPNSRNPFAFRMGLQYGQILDAMQHVRPNMSFMFTGGIFMRLDNLLRQPGNVVIISVDAYWTGGGPYLGKGSPSQQQSTTGVYVRPFAGIWEYRVATGTATLARLAQCPIVPCVTYMADGDTLVVEWGTPIPPPVSNDKDADAQITDQLIRYIERAVGRRPTQYVLEIGSSRCWNSSTGDWERNP
jgi:lauroyl/myristoyl acyltransferase